MARRLKLLKPLKDEQARASDPHVHAALSASAGTGKTHVLTARVLRPGSIIKEHRDPDLAVEEGCVRLHVPIATNPDVDFRLAGARVEMAPGSAWYLRLTLPHSVANRGTTARVHLVIDARVDEWLRALMAAGALA